MVWLGKALNYSCKLIFKSRIIEQNLENKAGFPPHYSAMQSRTITQHQATKPDTTEATSRVPDPGPSQSDSSHPHEHSTDGCRWRSRIVTGPRAKPRRWTTCILRLVGVVISFLFVLGTNGRMQPVVMAPKISTS